MSGYGYHWTPCPGRGKSGGDPGPILIVVFIVLVAACAGPVVAAAVELVEILAIAAASLITVSSVVAVLVWRSRRRRRATVELSARAPRVLTVAAAPVRLDRRAPAALEAPRTDAGTHVVTSLPARPRCAHRERRRP
jgi:hypothetical protein